MSLQTTLENHRRKAQHAVDEGTTGEGLLGARILAVIDHALREEARANQLLAALESVRDWAHRQADTYAQFDHEEEAWTPELSGVDQLSAILAGVGVSL